MIGSAFSDGLYGDDRSTSCAARAATTGSTAYGGQRPARRRRRQRPPRRRRRRRRARGGAGIDTASFDSAPRAWWSTSSAAPPAAAATTACSASRTSWARLRRPARRQRRGQRLDGSVGADVLVGRGGADRFVYTQVRQQRRGAGPHPRLQPHAGRPDRPARHRPQRAGGRATRRSSSSARPVHGRRSGPLLQGGRRHGGRGQSERRERPARRCGSRSTRWSRSRPPTSSCSGQHHSGTGSAMPRGAPGLGWGVY